LRTLLLGEGEGPAKKQIDRPPKQTFHQVFGHVLVLFLVSRVGVGVGVGRHNFM
jgi:hypothetical protein